MKYVYYITPEDIALARSNDSMLPPFSVGVAFAELAASLRNDLPESLPEVTVTRIANHPRVGKLIIVTSADKRRVEELLTSALKVCVLVLAPDPIKRFRF